MPALSQPLPLSDRPEPASFRDRTARVFHRGGGVYRRLNEVARANWERLCRTAFREEFTATGRLVETREVEPGVLEHEKIPFVSYPYEWTFGMLQDAALLTLELLQAALKEDMILKDGTAYNVQWSGCQPVFIDIPSLVTLDPGQPWVGYRQFCQQFLFPLLLQAHRGVPFQPWLRGRLEGITASECRSFFSLRDLFRPGVLKHVVLQALLQGRQRRPAAGARRQLRAAGFHKALIEANVAGLLRLVGGLKWKPPGSHWCRYEESWTYDREEVTAKEAFIDGVLSSRRWQQVWDLGCNRGHYTLRAAGHADLVLALDSDAPTIELLYQRLKQQQVGNVLPLVMDLADASPGQGWRGLERRGLGERGRPDLVLCLALIHHLVITAHLPLEEVIHWLAGLGGDLVIEFPTTEDPMVRALLDGRDEPVPDYDRDWFETCLGRSFKVVSRLPLEEGRRILYHAENRR